MDTSVANAMIETIRSERDRRVAELADLPSDAADDQWLFVHGPFLNDLTLMLLVVIHHQVERELIYLAARLGDTSSAMDRDEYWANVKVERRGFRKNPKGLVDRLGLTNSNPEWRTLDILRIVANFYKHDPFQQPDNEFLSDLNAILPQQLHFDITPLYAPISESERFREELAKSMGLPGETPYIDIAEESLTFAQNVPNDAKTRLSVRPIKPSRVRLWPLAE